MNPVKSSPNIILIMADQLRQDFLGCYGASFASTPNIDLLATKGKLFERAVSPSPICIPARASLLTGHNAYSTGVLTNNFWLRPDHEDCGMPTLASLLNEEGYHTEAIGKMHFIPWDLKEGFSHRSIAEDKRHIYIKDDYAEYLAEYGLRKYAGFEEPGYENNLMASFSKIPLEHQVDVWIGNQATKFLKDYSKDSPFFLFIGFAGPHDPYNPPKEALNSMESQEVPVAIPSTADSEIFLPSFIASHKNGSAQLDFTVFPESVKVKIRRHYACLMGIIDEQVGKILQVLNQTDNSRETVILFTSDHGDFLGDFDMVGKGLFHEPSISIPLIVSGASIECSRSKALVSLTDLFSTIIQLVGIKTILQDSVPLPLTESDKITRTGILGATGSGIMWLNKRWKLAYYKNGSATLHDLKNDPQEQRNRFSDPLFTEIKDELNRQMMAKMMESVTEGHLDKSYPYMTMSPDHPGHYPNWQRHYPSDRRSVYFGDTNVLTKPQ